MQIYASWPKIKQVVFWPLIPECSHLFMTKSKMADIPLDSTPCAMHRC